MCWKYQKFHSCYTLVQFNAQAYNAKRVYSDEVAHNPYEAIYNANILYWDEVAYNPDEAAYNANNFYWDETAHTDLHVCPLVCEFLRCV